jgi:hypothetical protein
MAIAKLFAGPASSELSAWPVIFPLIANRIFSFLAKFSHVAATGYTAYIFLFQCPGKGTSISFCQLYTPGWSRGEPGSVY